VNRSRTHTLGPQQLLEAAARFISRSTFLRHVKFIRRVRPHFWTLPRNAATLKAVLPVSPVPADLGCSRAVAYSQARCLAQ
jgi:hypothetical protein